MRNKLCCFIQRAWAHDPGLQAPHCEKVRVESLQVCAKACHWSEAFAHLLWQLYLAPRILKAEASRFWMCVQASQLLVIGANGPFGGRKVLLSGSCKVYLCTRQANRCGHARALEFLRPGPAETWRSPNTRCSFLGGPHTKDYSICGTIWGPPVMGNYHRYTSKTCIMRTEVLLASCAGSFRPN